MAQTVPPMAFYVSKGEETIDAEGTSFYNEAEIQEMVDQVAALYKYWPHEWGERRAELIGVISPYQAQVQRKSCLRLACSNPLLSGATDSLSSEEAPRTEGCQRRES